MLATERLVPSWRQNNSSQHGDVDMSAHIECIFCVINIWSWVLHVFASFLLFQEAFDFTIQSDRRMILTCTYLQKYYNDNPLPEYTERVLDSWIHGEGDWFMNYDSIVIVL